MPGLSKQAGKRNGPSRVLVMAPAQATSSELQAAIGSALPSIEVVLVERYPDPAAALDRAVGPGIKVCLVDAAAQPAAAMLVMTALAGREPPIAVVAVLPDNDPELMLRSLRCGATEFLIRPYTEDQILQVFSKTGATTGEAARAGPGRVLAVAPAKGGAGATTLACNLAIAVGRRVKGRVLLADLDGLAGTVSFVLKLRPAYSFVDALQHSGTLDPEVWKALVATAHGIDVLLSPESPVDGMDPDTDPTPVLDYARAKYDVVITDCGGVPGRWNSAIMNCATDILLVTTQQLASVRGAQRAIAHLERAVPGATAGVVVNRWRPNLPLSPEKIAASLGIEVLQTVPDSPDAIEKSLIDGKAAPGTSRYGEAVAALAGRFAACERRGAAAPGVASNVAGWFARLVN